MLQYIVVLLDDTATSFCHYDVAKSKSKLMPIDTLRAGIRFAMRKNLSVQFVYPVSPMPSDYLAAIDSVSHVNIMPADANCRNADAIVANSWQDVPKNPVRVPLIIRTGKSELFANGKRLAELLRRASRVDVVITDVASFTGQDLARYEAVLASVANEVEQMYVAGLSPQLNILTDRMVLQGMNNCGAGDTTITLAPNGKFYVCPAFYYEDEADSVDDIASGLDIKNAQLYKLAYAPICRHCDAWQCRRCVWLNRKTTLEENTPSHEQCVVAHAERNAARRLLQDVRRHGAFLPDSPDIEELDYIDPFEKKDTWK